MLWRHAAILRNRSNYQLYRMYKEIDDVESELLECQKECATTEIEIYNANQLKDKGTYVLENVKRRYNDLEEELKEVHCNYLKCIEKANNESIQQKIDSLTLQRDNLKRELEELNKAADANNKKIVAVKKMIKIQEKKNMALIRKLKKFQITPDLNDRVNMILTDPRLIKQNNSN
ncbi:uncharacterized protein LOC122571117 isoform X2 [Bombus pyrosoma]|uniref:uncharacterized protein LOC122571117 isoform X2 n=1 Tax=Bombus pyrosoma TaxID=396416 RepID=UPI001CB997C2|nr:uncharacterized protein LOC122571117 isoform X2 [Bombus pyrosoma]